MAHLGSAFTQQGSRHNHNVSSQKTPTAVKGPKSPQGKQNVQCSPSY